MYRQTISRIVCLIQIPVVIYCNVGRARVKTAGHGISALKQVAVVPCRPVRQVFTDALAHKVGHGTFFIARADFECPGLFFRKLDLYPDK